MSFSSDFKKRAKQFYEFNYRKLRNEATVTCTNKTINKCNPLIKPCLFDVISDPCELNNLANNYPNIVKSLVTRLLEFNASSIAPANLPIDERANPIYFDHTWTNFGDFI